MDTMKIKDIIVDLSLNAQFVDLHYFRLSGMGQIILMYGTSTAGKSSITKEFLKIDPRMIEWNLDLTYDPGEARSPQILKAFIHNALLMAVSGRSFVMHMDNPDLLFTQMKTYGVKVPVKTVLVFCPLWELQERILIRNEEAQEYGDWTEFRDNLIPIEQYSKLYGATESAEYLELLEISDVSKIYREQFNRMVNNTRALGGIVPSNDQLIVELELRTDAFLRNLGFSNNNNIIKIAPKKEYDIILLNFIMSETEDLLEDDKDGNSSMETTIMHLAGNLAQNLGYSHKHIESIFNMELE
jgi:hypothetical protein